METMNARYHLHLTTKHNTCEKDLQYSLILKKYDLYIQLNLDNTQEGCMQYRPKLMGLNTPPYTITSKGGGRACSNAKPFFKLREVLKICKLPTSICI